MNVSDVLNKHNYIDSGDERDVYFYITAYYKGDCRNILIVSDDTTYIKEVKYLDNNRSIKAIEELPENPSLEDMIEYTDLCSEVWYVDMDKENIYSEDETGFKLLCWKIELGDDVIYGGD